MASSRCAAVLMITISMVAVTLPYTADASCLLMLEAWKQCTTYVTHKTDKISPDCCKAVDALADKLEDATKSEKVEACNCFQASAKIVRDLDITLVDKVNDYCGAKFSFPLNLEFDCSKAS
ncbi:Non-specific lipid-transfer protein 3-like protein [Drosera capensis]